MKTAEQIASEHLDSYHFFEKDNNMWKDILKAMKEYALQYVQKASEVAEADLEIISDEANAAWSGRTVFEEGVDYEVSISRESILQLKKEIENEK